MHSMRIIRASIFFGLNANMKAGDHLVEVVAWVFVGVFIAVSAIYWPYVAVLNVPLASARQMLLLIPQNTILKLPVLR